MESPSPQGGDDASSSHTRTTSSARRQALRRQITRDPLDADDDPLAPKPPSSRLSLLPQQQQQSGAPSRSQSRSPRPPNPNAPRKNFGFLLRPDNFHALDEDVPEVFRNPITIEASESLLSNAISEGRFRTAAVLAAELLRSKSDPSDHVNIFALLQARLICLQLCGLHDFAAQESKALQDFNAVIYRDEVTGRNLVPWTLRVIAVRLQALGFGDWRRAVMAYYDLAREARFEARRPNSGDEKVWIVRLQDIGIRVANALVEMGDLEGATRFLQSLPTADGPAIQQRLAMVFLNAGDVAKARQCVASDGEASQEQAIQVLCDMAEGRLEDALEKLQASSSHQMTPIFAQNLAVCLVYTGRIQEAKAILENQIDAGSTSTDVLFNLATIFELCSDKSKDHKAALAIKVSQQKHSSEGWEKSNADFKL